MCAARRILNTLQASEYLTFYHLMKYPVPKQEELFMDGSFSKPKSASLRSAPLLNAWTKPKNTTDKPIKQQKQGEERSSYDHLFSRDQENALLGSYLSEVEAHEKLYQSLPFVEEIYLCNSLTFNALHKTSDIDVFIITRPKRIWTAKFFAMVMTFFAGVKRLWSKKAKKICLSFFVTSADQNLYHLSVKGVDIYLCYRIAHLVLLYQADPHKTPQIRQKNKRIQGILPNLPLQQNIFLGNQVFSGQTSFKKTIEWLGSGILGDGIELVLKILQLAIISLKRLRNPHKNRGVIVNNQMLKFHQDIREKVSLKYAVMKKK